MSQNRKMILRAVISAALGYLLLFSLPKLLMTVLMSLTTWWGVRTARRVSNQPSGEVARLAASYLDAYEALNAWRTEYRTRANKEVGTFAAWVFRTTPRWLWPGELRRRDLQVEQNTTWEFVRLSMKWTDFVNESKETEYPELAPFEARIRQFMDWLNAVD